MTSPEIKTVRFKDTVGGDYRSAKTGKIPCLNEFNAEVRLITPYPGFNDWRNIWIAIVADQIPVGQFIEKFRSLHKKDDPSAMMYGFYLYGDHPTNLKKTSFSSAIPRDNVLKIRYSKKDQTVRFSCSTFDYY